MTFLPPNIFLTLMLIRISTKSWASFSGSAIVRRTVYLLPPRDLMAPALNGPHDFSAKTRTYFPESK